MEQEKKSHGALIGSIIIIVLLVIGGIYVWQVKVKEMRLENERIQKQINDLNSESITEINNLEQEVNKTDINIDTNALKNVN